MSGDIPPGIRVVPIPKVYESDVVKMIAIPKEDMGNLIRVKVLADPEDIIVPLAIAYPAEPFPLLDIGVVYAHPKPVREPAHRHELRGDVFQDATGERLYAEINGVAQ
jgi:hypothetical protein